MQWLKHEKFLRICWNYGAVGAGKEAATEAGEEEQGTRGSAKGLDLLPGATRARRGTTDATAEIPPLPPASCNILPFTALCGLKFTAPFLALAASGEQRARSGGTRRRRRCEGAGRAPSARASGRPDSAPVLEGQWQGRQRQGQDPRPRVGGGVAMATGERKPKFQ